MRLRGPCPSSRNHTIGIKKKHETGDEIRVCLYSSLFYILFTHGVRPIYCRQADRHSALSLCFCSCSGDLIGNMEHQRRTRPDQKNPYRPSFFFTESSEKIYFKNHFSKRSIYHWIPGQFFLLPCTSGPYGVIIGMLSSTSTRFQALVYLLIYNFIFIIPFIAIILAVGLGLTTTARVEK